MVLAKKHCFSWGCRCYPWPHLSLCRVASPRRTHKLVRTRAWHSWSTDSYGDDIRHRGELKLIEELLLALRQIGSVVLSLSTGIVVRPLLLVVFSKFYVKSANTWNCDRHAPIGMNVYILKSQGVNCFFLQGSRKSLYQDLSHDKQTLTTSVINIIMFIFYWSLEQWRVTNSTSRSKSRCKKIVLWLFPHARSNATPPQALCWCYFLHIILEFSQGLEIRWLQSNEKTVESIENNGV